MLTGLIQEPFKFNKTTIDPPSAQRFGDDPCGAKEFPLVKVSLPLRISPEATLQAAVRAAVRVRYEEHARCVVKPR